MEQLKIFENEEFGQIRTVMRDGEVWFVGKDVAEALGFTNSRDAIATHVFDDDKGVEIIDTLGGKQKMTAINESGLYALVFGSRLESAKRFKRWVTYEVLPTIRNTGSYDMSGDEVFTIQARRCKRCGRLLTSQEAVERGYGCQCAMKAKREEEAQKPMPGQQTIFDYLEDAE